MTAERSKCKTCGKLLVHRHLIHCTKVEHVIVCPDGHRQLEHEPSRSGVLAVPEAYTEYTKKR